MFVHIPKNALKQFLKPTDLLKTRLCICCLNMIVYLSVSRKYL